MERITIKEFKNQSKIEIIESIMKMNNGYVTSKELSNLGIHRMYLNIMKEKGMIERVGNGIYIDSNKIEDCYFVFGSELSNIIYSHMTALYFHGLSIKAPNDKYDITVPNNYFNYKIKNHNVFYVDKDIYELGLIQIDTPMGNKVKAYNMERCICDIIRSKNRMDSEHVKHSIREYVKRKDKDLFKLSKYAEKLGIKKEVMDYVEVFYE
ncbi:MAG: type IV toxin-antitoxin system AbiEi family antitoxin domain-containing protein [Bacilli bacterium]|nr:type IV toxin-antitoxin system AbiEi family antitoxin domain-containing protein [Bacilli bacterium]